MDVHDPHLGTELDRRLDLVAQEWRAGHAPALGRLDILVLIAIIAVAGLVAVVAGLAR